MASLFSCSVFSWPFISTDVITFPNHANKTGLNCGFMYVYVCHPSNKQNYIQFNKNRFKNIGFSL